jgi:hypothetical protein
MPNETMNTEYHTIDGATFTATDPSDLMTKLRQDSFNPEADLPSYCRATARAPRSPYEFKRSGHLRKLKRFTH